MPKTSEELIMNGYSGGGGETEDLGSEEYDSSDESDDGEPVEVLQKNPRPNAIYNSVGLHEKLEEVAWPEDIDWLHTLCITYPSNDAEIDVNDDLSREMAFYTQALEGTREAYTKLKSLGIPFLRPEDYYAEMVKSDSQMLKIKDMLLSQQKQIEEAEERKKAREAKQFAKEVQAQKIKQRAQEKKQNIETVKKWRKMRQDSGFEGGEDQFPIEFGDGDDDKSKPRSKKQKIGGDKGRSPFNKNPGKIFGSGEADEPIPYDTKFSNRTANNRSKTPWDRSGGKGGKSKPNKKRQLKNAKFGQGGRKGLKKINTADSSAGFFGSKGGKGSKGKSKKR